jgi:hypothetical protein
MASLFGMLLDTMPFAAAAHAIRQKYGKWFNECEAHEAREFISMLAPDASFDVDLPEVNRELDTEEQPLWAFSHGGRDPAQVRAVYCRVHDADYVAHCVTEKIEWGLEDPVDSFQKAVRVTFASGGQVLLPLTTEHVFWKFRVRGGSIPSLGSGLWQLTSNLDSSLLVVFAYDIDPATGEIKKMDVERIRDTTVRDEVKKAMEAAKQLLGYGDKPGQGGAEGSDGGTTPPPQGEEAPPPDMNRPPPPDVFHPQPAPPEEEAKAPWGTTVLRGDFWPEAKEGSTASGPNQHTSVSGQVGQLCDVMTEPARLLVVFSFTTCCQRADFEAGGMVGFARCYPHLLVSATVPIKKIEASCHLDRPKELVTWAEPGREGSCCKPPYDGSSKEIRGLLVTDENNPTCLITKGGGPPLPFWSNMFAYMLVDPYRVPGPKKIHVVRTDRPQARVSDRGLVHRETVLGDAQDLIEKQPYQGEFDNVHIAPRLKLMNVDAVKVESILDTELRYPISDRAKWHFDEIAMAPFCAHDCLHMHWRWPRNADSKWVLGWGSSGPYQVAGAPMVPIGQDVWLWFRSDHRLTYHVTAPPCASPSNWTVLMHHGFGHAVAIEAKRKTELAMFAVNRFSDYCLASGWSGIDSNESTAVYYWMARYDVKLKDGKPYPVERVTWESADDLRDARDL